MDLKTCTLAIGILRCLARHPEYQAKLQAELDEVIGRERLPDFGDEGKLPYLRCIISEALRSVPFFVSHMGLF